MEKTRESRIRVYDKLQRTSFGVYVAEGYSEAWNFDTNRKGVVNEEGRFIHTYPLNGWRERDLAESAFEMRDGSLIREVGKVFIAKLEDLKKLPGFDAFYYDELDKVDAKLVVQVHVVVVDGSYGSHILVEGLV